MYIPISSKKCRLMFPGCRSPHCQQLPGLKVRHGVARSGSSKQWLSVAILPPASKVPADMAARELGGWESGGVSDEAGKGRLLGRSCDTKG